MTKKNEQVQINLERLDLEVIHKVINFLELKWKDTTTGERRVPNIDEISIVAKECMNKAWESEDGVFKMGGFEAEVVEDTIGIKFILTEALPLSEILG